MKNVKVLFLTFFLTMTGYTYASGTTQSSTDCNQKRISAALVVKACCAAKAECCKPDAECCKAGAECCKAEMSCCDKGNPCCNGDGCNVAKADTAKGERGATCAGCAVAAVSADTLPATPPTMAAKGCCGSACKGTVSTKK